MGQLNQPTNLLDRVVQLERAVEAIRKLSGLTSAIIRRGGITLLDDSFLKMVDDLERQILYIGPNVDGKQVFALRRENGSTVLQSDFFAGQPFFAMRDQNNIILFSDNAAGSGGMARPWLPVPIYQCFRPQTYNGNAVGGEVLGYSDINNTELVGEKTLWEGSASILHKFLEVDGVWGRSQGTAHTIKYRIRLNGTEVGTWTVAGGITSDVRGPFSIAAFLDQNVVNVKLTAELTVGGTGATACQIKSMYMRQ